MGRLSKGERERRDVDVLRGAIALILTTAVAAISTTSGDAAAPLSAFSPPVLAVVALGVVMICMTLRATSDRPSRAKLVAMTVALVFVVSGELAALTATTMHGDGLTASALLAALGFTVWFAFGIATEDERRRAEQPQGNAKDTR